MLLILVFIFQCNYITIFYGIKKKRILFNYNKTKFGKYYADSASSKNQGHLLKAWDLLQLFLCLLTCFPTSNPTKKVPVLSYIKKRYLQPSLIYLSNNVSLEWSTSVRSSMDCVKDSSASTM